MHTQAPVSQAQLTEAFSAFNRLSAELSDAYEALQQRVVRLNAELAAARSARLRELAEKERLAERLSGILQALPGAVIVLDEDGRVSEINPLAREWLGEPLMGERWAGIAARELGGEVPGSLQLTDGRAVNVAVRRLESGHGRIVLMTDETETRALRELAGRNQRLAAMGEMVARLAHQVRTPLASALLYVSRLAGGATDAETTRRCAGKGLDRLHQLERLIDDMLRFSRGDAAVEHRPLSVETLFRELGTTLEPQLEAAGACLDCALRDGLTLAGDREALVGMLGNLVSNALEATGEGGHVLLRADARPDGGVRLEVADDGPGIPAAQREYIFDPFYTTRTAGTGLGLAVVRAVTESHGATIEVGEGPAGGALFRIDFPSVRGESPLPSVRTSVTEKAVNEDAVVEVEA